MTARARTYASIVSCQVPPPVPRRIGRAVVLGGSIAGLMAARVLADVAEEVLVIEADDTDPAGGPRPGVPQGSQVHALLAAGQLQLERWFPGFTKDARADGAVLPTPEAGQFFINGVSRQNVATTDVPGILASRPFIEALIRRRTLESSAVRIITGRAGGIRLSGTKVVGATYAPDGAHGDDVELDADLVVDATGRSSRLPDWLEKAGWPAPQQLRMPIKLNYATAVLRRDRRVLDTDTLATVSIRTPEPGQVPRIGGFVAIENDRWILLVAGYDEDRPSRGFDDFSARCKRDFPAMFGEIVDKCELLGDVVTYHQADSRRRDYDRLPRFPARLLVAGDAVASFNPVYGQGMTSAILHASCLSAYLRSDPDLDTPAKSYFDDVRVIVDAAWQTSTFPDLALPHVSGPYPRGYRVTKRMSSALLAGSIVDDELNLRLSKVTGMLTHPDSLTSASTLARALRSERRLRKQLSARAS